MPGQPVATSALDEQEPTASYTGAHKLVMQFVQSTATQIIRLSRVPSICSVLVPITHKEHLSSLLHPQQAIRDYVNEQLSIQVGHHL